MSGYRNLSSNVRVTAEGTLACAHCDGDLPGDPADHLALLPIRIGPSSEAGPHIYPDPSVWVDAQIVFRQVYCPHCWVAMHTEVVPA